MEIPWQVPMRVANGANHRGPRCPWGVSSEWQSERQH